MQAKFMPSKARGTFIAPPSKSMAHRLLICAGLANGESVIRNLAYSEDVKATIACLRSLGAQIRLDGDTAYVNGTDVTKPLGATAILPCNECGSTLRFFIPICLLSGEERVLTGSARLMTRPLSVYEQIAEAQGFRLERFADKVVVEGKLRSAVFEIPGNISSQFISGLMFALPLLESGSLIRVIPPVESLSYLNMTVGALKTFGIAVKRGFPPSEHSFVREIPGGGAYLPADVTVEGDWSNAAFFEALNYAGSDVSIEGLNEASAQGDKVYKILFKKISNADIIDIGGIDISDCPDLGPILFAVAALCGGGRFTGTRRLKIKESDRAVAMKHELKKLGIDVTVGENSVIVHPGTLRAPVIPISGHNDHRIVMAMSVLLTVTGGVIEGAEAVKKSFPDFFERLQALGIEVQLCNGSVNQES